MSQNRQVLLKRNPDGVPVEADFEVSAESLPEARPGHTLCRTRYLSLDPYMRSQISGRHMSGVIVPGELMLGESVCEVVESPGGRFRAGDRVRCMGGWQEYPLLPDSELNPVPEGVEPASLALSLLGMTGLTAWAGMNWLAGVKPGDHVFIPAVTGGVGSAAAQFCRDLGARVVGMAGSAEKCRFAVAELGVEDCIDRNATEVDAALQERFPNGIDVFFDLVGGALLDAVSRRLAISARIVLCGLMSEYNAVERRPGPPPGLWIRARATVHGLVVYDFEHRRDEFIGHCLPGVVAGRLRQKEDVTTGIENAAAAFCRLMRGENFGKTIVAC